jgi:hypothetical protein
LVRGGFGCTALSYDIEAKRYVVTVVLTKQVKLPASVYVTPEEEDRFGADPRRHLLLPFEEERGEESDPSVG